MKAQPECGLLSVAVLTISALFGLAACSGSAGNVEVSGTETCTPTAAIPAGSQYAFDCTDTMSDDRVSGSGEAVGTVSSDGTTTEGSYTLSNEKGSWSGNWTGTIETDGTEIIDGTLNGSGGYSGWTYTFHLESIASSGSEFSATMTGTIEPPG